MVVKSKIFAVMACALILSIGTAAHAGLLATHPLAFNNGSGPALGAWRGTTPFVNGALTGTVDWAVFTAANFASITGVAGYVPPANHLVYTQQVFTTGVQIGASQLDVALSGFPVGTSGSFTATGITGLATATTSVTPLLASFTLAGETTAANPSRGLAYSSPRIPQLTGVAKVIDGGTAAFGTLLIGVPSAVPEPSTCLIAGLASCLMFVHRGLRRR
jgi:hypothetical protein